MPKFMRTCTSIKTVAFPVAGRAQRISSRSRAVARVSRDKSDTRTRQEIEQAYYEEWERLTLVPEEELNRPMTPATFVKFVPMWLRYNAIPGPVRYWLFKDTLGTGSGGRK